MSISQGGSNLELSALKQWLALDRRIVKIYANKAKNMLIQVLAYLNALMYKFYTL